MHPDTNPTALSLSFLKAPFSLFGSQCTISNDNAQNEQVGMICQNEFEMVSS